MRIAGLVGGIAPESTVEYYRLLIARYRERTGDGSYPPLIVNSIDLTRMIGLIGAGRLDEVTDYLAGEVERLTRAGASFGAFASNTPHVVFDALRRRATITLVSIVETARDAAVAAGRRRLGLFGTRFTMQAGFYPDTLSPAGIAVVLPSVDEQAEIHHRYMNELVLGSFRPETRERFVGIARRMASQDGIDGLILGGTELPILLRDVGDLGLPLLDTGALHVEALVTRMLA
jgi:aspartate racemase